MTLEVNPGSGDVQIQLEGKPHALKCTLQAAMILSSQPDGIIGLTRRIQNFDLNAFVLVIGQGLGKQSRDLPGLIYRTGLFELQLPCIRYLTNLANGGKPQTVEEEVKESEEIEVSADPLEL